MDGRHYYGFFLKIFELLDTTHSLYHDIRQSANHEIKIYVPKYLSVVSTNPFFISFKCILEEIYQQSILNDSKGFKIENIISTLIFRMYLPKYETTQLSWALNDKVYSFSQNFFKSEISFRLLFSYISLDKVVLIFVAFLMNSIIVFFHSK